MGIVLAATGVCVGAGLLTRWFLVRRANGAGPWLGWRPEDPDPGLLDDANARLPPPEPGSFTPPPEPWTGPWVPAGAAMRVQGYEIPGGLLYVGTSLEGAEKEIDPALIDPRLPVDRTDPDWQGQTMDYWPFYSDLLPEARAAYLSWLAGGRCAPDAYIGYVFLFFYGLERRVLVDLIGRSTPARDLTVISGEVRRLLDCYGANDSFRRYAVAFLDFIDLLSLGKDPAAASPPPCGPRRQPSPVLRLGLGRLAAGPGRVPADWALSWAWHHPRIEPCAERLQNPERFQELFLRRFDQRHPDGLAVRADGDTLYLSYRPASAGFSGMGVGVEEVALPDVLEQPDATRELARLAADAAAELAACPRPRADINPPERGTRTLGR